MTLYSFPKSERISSQKEIDLLFSKGSSFSCFPIRIVYIEQEVTPERKSGASVLISVPKKRFKRAVHRNRLKRLIREAYRLNKNSFAEKLERTEKNMLVAFLYVGNEIADFDTIEKAIIKSLAILQEKPLS